MPYPLQAIADQVIVITGASSAIGLVYGTKIAATDGAVHGDSPHRVMRSVYTKVTLNPVGRRVRT